MNLINENTENLFALWRYAASPFEGYGKNNNVNKAIIKSSQWPNRVWVNGDITNETIALIKEEEGKHNFPITIPYLDIYNSHSYRLLEENGFSLKFEQTAMVKELSGKYELSNELSFVLATTAQQALIWEDIYPQAFGYKISGETVLMNSSPVEYYLVYVNNTPIGNGMILTQNGIAGLHGVGVIPNARRKGYANEIMKFLMNRALEQNAEYAVLQASSMGKGIYTKLGFTEQFTIRNYVKRRPE